MIGPWTGNAKTRIPESEFWVHELSSVFKFRVKWWVESWIWVLNWVDELRVFSQSQNKLRKVWKTLSKSVKILCSKKVLSIWIHLLSHDTTKFLLRSGIFQLPCRRCSLPPKSTEHRQWQALLFFCLAEPHNLTCGLDWRNLSYSYLIAIMVFVYVLPITVLIVCYYKINVKVRESRAKINAKGYRPKRSITKVSVQKIERYVLMSTHPHI